MEPLNAMPKYNLFGLEEQDYKNAKVVVLPVPYDATSTYKSGSRNGPHAIIEASRNLELYSYELGKDISKIGIYTTDELAPDLSSPESMISRISREVAIILEDGKVPLLLGGEHTITLGAIKALHDRKEEISILQFDAHTDSREEIFGSKYTHASVMARAKEMYDSIFQIGIRSIDEASAGKIDKDKVLFMDQIHAMSAEEIADSVISSTREKLYITIDLDVLDPSEMPSVGTPEPDGMSFRQLCEVLKAIAGKKKLAGIDIVELNPIPYMHAPDFLAAKLAYLALGYFF